MRGTRWDEREGRTRGRVISFLCLLLIYSDAPRLSASGANKFLEPPWQLDTLPSLHFFPRRPPPPSGPFSPARSAAATRYSGRIEQPAGAAAARCSSSEKKRPVNVTRDRTPGFCVLDQIVAITVCTLRNFILIAAQCNAQHFNCID